MKNSFFRYLFLVAVLLSYTSVEAQQKAKDQSAEQQSHLLKPLDIAACMSWKRVESPDISPTGRWVTYRIAPMEYNSDDKESKILHLFDSRTRKEIVLPDVEQIQYYDADRAVYYEQADTAGNMKTILMSLPSGVKTEWTYKESFHPVEGVPYSVSVSNVPEDTVNHIPSFDRLVVRHLKTGTAFQIDSIGYYTLYNQNRSILFIRKQAKGNALCYGPLVGPYRTIYQSSVKKGLSSFSLDKERLTGEFTVKDSLWYNFSLKNNTCDLVFDRKEIVIPAGMELVRASLSSSQKFLTMELRPYQEKVNKDKKEEEIKPDKSFELELWTWDEYEVPTLQTRSRYSHPQYSKYIYDITSQKLTEVAPGHADLLEPDRAEEIHYVLYTDETPYRAQKDWLNEMPFDIYSVNVHTGEKQLVGRSYRTRPRWSVNGKWAVMYDPVAQVWNKFDGKTGEVTDISTAIGYPIFEETYDKPNPAPAYGIAGWTADGNNVLIYDAYDWWKIDLTGERQPECITKGYGRKNQRSIRKMTSNIDKEVFNPDETIIVSVWDENTMDEGIYSLDMKGRLKKLAEGPYIYSIHRFSDNGTQTLSGESK